MLDQHLVKCIKRLNRVTSPCYPPRSILRKPWLLIVFSTISSCDSLVENTIHWSWSFFGYCRLLNREGAPGVGVRPVYILGVLLYHLVVRAFGRHSLVMGELFVYIRCLPELRVPR